MEYIKIKNKDYPIIFNILAFRKFSQEKGVNDLNKIDEIFKGFSGNMGFDQMDDFVKLTMHGIKEGCRQDAKEFDLTHDDVFVFLFDDIKNQSNLKLISDILGRFTKTAGGDGPGEDTPQA